MMPRLARLARWPAVLGVGVALAVSLWREGLPAGGMAGVAVPWPGWLLWLGGPLYRSDTLSAGLGAWCLALGLLAVLKVGRGARAHLQLANAIAIIAVLYSLMHTDHLLAYAGQLFLLTALILASQEGADYSRSMAGLGLGAVLLFGAALLIGRTMGGGYSLSGLSLSALSVWPLVLLAGFCLLWLGMPPATGWSARLYGDRSLAALVQALAIGLPVFALLLRLQGLVSAQALAGTVPEGWTAFMNGLAWLGAAGALVTGANLLLWAGSARWAGHLTAFAMSLALWAICQDNPLGRLSGLAILLAYGAARMLSELSRHASSLTDRTAGVVALASLAAAPLTPMFAGAWLLASLLSGTRHPGLAIVLVGAIILAACGIVLHYVGTDVGTAQAGMDATPSSWLGLALAVASVVGGAAPGLWLPQVARMAEAGGGTAPVGLPWEGLSAGGLFVPVLLLVMVGVSLGGVGWLAAAWARSSANVGGVLLPTGLDRVEKARESRAASVNQTWEGGAARTLTANPSGAVWWLSLTWLEGGVWGFGALLGRLGSRFGGLLGRLEGRFYLPLALILALVALLVAVR